MKFTSHDRKYEIDKFGVINQTDHRPFNYDDNYIRCYDGPDYIRETEKLQALRLGFVYGAHGARINTLIDVGYGNGAFMKFAKQNIPYIYGHDVTGVQIDGCLIMPDIIKANVLTMWDVLEHFADLSFVKDLPVETIVLSLPYCHLITEGKEWFDNNYHHRKPDEHLHHFNEFSLQALMCSLGWKTIAVSGHEDIVRKSRHGLQNILSMAFKRS